MIEFIPLELYTPIFNYIILTLVVLAVLQSLSGRMFERDTVRAYCNVGVVILLILTLYIGLRPVSGYYFGDTGNYAKAYRDMASSMYVLQGKQVDELAFYYPMRFFAQSGVSVHMFFLYCATLYFGANFVATRKIFGIYYYIPLLVIMCMFGFMTHAVNAMRAGLAYSFLLVAFAYRGKMMVMIPAAVLGYYMHNSAILLIVAGIAAWVVRNPKLYLLAWIGSIAASLAMGGSIGAMFDSSGLGGDRVEGYMDATDGDMAQFGIFRWDFVAYSALPVIVGAYFIFKRAYTDRFYVWLFCIYLLSNSFWILVIRAMFSNRFAAPSWALMPLVLIYPFIKERFWPDQQQKIGYALIAFYSFTFVYNILLG